MKVVIASNSQVEINVIKTPPPQKKPHQKPLNVPERKETEKKWDNRDHKLVFTKMKTFALRKHC